MYSIDFAEFHGCLFYFFDVLNASALFKLYKDYVF